MRSLVRWAAVAAASLASACGITGPGFGDEGVVRFVDVEGGCWVIDVGQARLEPINLPEELRVDGIRIVFEAEERQDLVSTCQLGRIVELTSVRAADG